MVALLALTLLIFLATVHWQQDVLKAYICTSFVRAHHQYFSADASDLLPGLRCTFPGSHSIDATAIT